MDKFAGLSKATLGNASNSEDSNSYINGAAFESFLKSYREMNKVEPQYPTNDKPKVSRMIAHKYFIEDPDHSFHKLHNKTGSIDIDKIINDDFDPNTVQIGDTIQFILSLNDEHLPVYAKVTCTKIFEIVLKNPKSQLDMSDELAASNKPSTSVDSSDLESILKMFLENQATTQSVMPAPQVKRKVSTFNDESSETDVKTLETTNRAFTEFLRKRVDELADEYMDYDKTIGHYATKYPLEMNHIKKDLLKFVPMNKTFKDAWRLANQAIAQERSMVKCGKKFKK